MLDSSRMKDKLIDVIDVHSVTNCPFPIFSIYITALSLPTLIPYQVFFAVQYLPSTSINTNRKTKHKWMRVNSVSNACNLLLVMLCFFATHLL